MARQPPAQQRLAADHAPVAQVDLGLVEHHKLVALDRAPELALQHQPLDRDRAHLGREEAAVVAAILLRVIHRGVSVADQVDDVVRILRAERDAEAAGDIELVLSELERPAELVQQFARQRRDGRAVVLVARQILDEQRELVAGEPAEHRAVRHAPDHPLAQDLERAIAGRVTEGVVDLLEIVEVDVDQRERLAAAARARDRLLQRMLELQPVRDLGQRVVARQVADPALGALAFGDVARNEDAALEARIVAPR